MTALISDVHGNLAALEAVLEAIDRMGCRHLISLGDVAGYYCDLDDCIRLLRSREALHLMGNHDRYLLDGGLCPRSRSATMCLQRQAALLSEEGRAWLAAAPVDLEMGELSLRHGGWADPLEEYLHRPTAAYFAALPGRLFVSGHTHVQRLDAFGAQTYCNPGSVGQPRDGDPRAAFATLAGDAVTLHRVSYDVDRTVAAMAEAGFPAAFSSNLRHGLAIGGVTPPQPAPSTTCGKSGFQATSHKKPSGSAK